jgi:hypothetical protein
VRAGIYCTALTGGGGRAGRILRHSASGSSLRLATYVMTTEWPRCSIEDSQQVFVELEMLQCAADVIFVTPLGVDFDEPNLFALDRLVCSVSYLI